MATKTVTIILFAADRELWTGSKARLTVTDLSRSPLRVLKQQNLKPGTSTVIIRLDLHFDAGQVYGLSIDVPKHRSAWQLINRRSFLRRESSTEVEGSDIILRLMLLPRKTTSSDLTLGYERMLEAGSPLTAGDTGLSEGEYLAMSVARQMALLNVEAKLRETLVLGVPVSSYVRGVRYVAADRVFLFVHASLKQLVELSPDFASVRGHKSPDDVPIQLPAHPESWKHRGFAAGNLQLSFARDSQTLPSDPGKPIFSVDADIDLATGLDHVFEWLKNNVFDPGNKTDQFRVYALLFAQNVTPYYTLDRLPAPGSQRLS
jgi:hypothetical protein